MSDDIDTTPNKKWYQKGWGIVVAILLLPLFVIWYAWSESSWSQNTKIAATVGMVLLMGVSVAVTPSTDEAANETPNTSQSETELAEVPDDTVNETAEQVETPAETNDSAESNEAEQTEVQEAPTYSLAQQNAIESAESYLDFSGFSRQGLIDQLEFEQYSTEDATIAVDSLDVDWNAEAVESAESYLDFSSFSCQGLIDQLLFEDFTSEQAQYGAEAVGLCE